MYLVCIVKWIKSLKIYNDLNKISLNSIVFYTFLNSYDIFEINLSEILQIKDVHIKIIKISLIKHKFCLLDLT